MYFDTHAHYDSGAFQADRLALLGEMPALGVSLILNPGCDMDSSHRAVELAETFPYVFAAVGVHPNDCETYSDEVEEALRALTAHPKVVAVGEIGLDYHWKDNAPAAEQLAVFHRQLALAQEVCLPVIVHDREAHADCLSAVRQHPGVTGVYHCYSGGVEDAKTLVDLGWMISFTGTVTYSNARRALEVIRALPMEHIMIETDAPYLTPEPHRGKRNHSGFLPLVAEVIAREKGLSPEEAARITLENGKRFFRIP